MKGKRGFLALGLVLILLAAAAGVVWAQGGSDYRVSKQQLTAGGGEASSTNYRIKGGLPGGGSASETDAYRLAGMLWPGAYQAPPLHVGFLAGRVRLQGRPLSGGVTVCFDSIYCATTGSDGSFLIENVPLGTYLGRLSASMPGYLPAEGIQEGLQVIAGRADLPELTLYAGDIDGNSTVDIPDLAAVAASFSSDDEIADLNESGLVDVYDLVQVGMNFGKTESPWPNE